jgi:hypothetical protein
VIINDATNVRYTVETNAEGIYSVPNLPPGSYRAQVSKQGFKTIVHPDIVLHVQDAEAIGFTLPVGPTSDTVTVEGGAPLVNTENAAVSTVIDRNFVESLPLNGRSFNTLLQLTPGVVIAPIAGSSAASGQFSIAGQRASSNSFLVDGVSANFGVATSPVQGTAGTGSSQAFSAFGGTSSLVSVEALQEFRIETSSFAPEFGRSPGGQVILNTRSGANDFHGGVYEYFRNDVLDANNWFNDDAIPPVPKAPERHNDFGGFVGGPIHRGQTFFFASYEGARLRLPNTILIQVPSEFARTSPPTPASLLSFLNAYPQPDDKTVTSGVYTSRFTGSFSNPATLNAGSIRLDHTFNDKFSIFGRYNEAPSQAVQRTRSLSEVDTNEVDTRTVTVGATMTLSSQLSNSLRANYSKQNSSAINHLDTFGGAVPPSQSLLAPNLPTKGLEVGFLIFGAAFYITGTQANNRNTQLNFADDLSVTRGRHQLKFGMDYRANYLDLRLPQSSLVYIFPSVQSLVSTSRALLLQGGTGSPTYLLAQSTSLYAQDTWKIAPRLSLTYGVRWELSPSPSPRAGSKLAAWQNVDDPAALALAPFGTPLWSTTYTNFAPRIGVAYKLTEKGDLVLRGGWGMFYDLASDSVASLGLGFTNFASKNSFLVNVPLTDASPFIPRISPQPPFPDMTVGFAPNLTLPRSFQWNVALEKSFGGKQALSLTYVGQAGRDLLRQEALQRPNSNFNGSFLLTQNDARSNYHALQLQFRRPLSTRLQAVANYTWSHSLDNASNDILPAITGPAISAANDYASSDFDVRHSFSGAVTYAIPSAKEGILAYLSREWSIATVIVARSGFPFNASFFSQFGGPGARPDLIPGQALYLYGMQCDTTFQGLGVLSAGQSCPGGKGLNPNAFNARRPVGRQGTESRNDIPGFGLTQVDLSVGRKFRLGERLNLQFRADGFNVLNHPNFSRPFGNVSSGPSTYLSQSMLNLGLGGLNPLFQEGGPRSLQLSLKLMF